jgi:6-phosphogluconolactonase
MKSSLSRRAALAALSSGLFSLAGCGGTQLGESTAPTPTPTSPAPTPGPAPRATRTYAYVTNSGSGTVSIYHVSDGGALIHVGEVDAGRNVLSVAIHPSGRFAYAVNDGDNTVSAYTIEPATGMLTPHPTGPFVTGNQPQQMRIHPTGKFAYVGNFADGTVSVYSIENDGRLTAGDTVDVGTFPSGLAFDPTGGFLFVESDDRVTSYAVNTDSNPGELTLVNSAGTGGLPGDVAIAPSGRSAYVVGLLTGEVMVHPIDASGALGAGTSVPAGDSSHAITIDPLGQFAYVANFGDQTISVYTIDQGDGALLPSGPGAIATGPQPGSVAISPTGQFAYVTSRSENSVHVFTVNRTTGRLQPLGAPVPAGTGAFGITVVGIPQ